MGIGEAGGVRSTLSSQGRKILWGLGVAAVIGGVFLLICLLQGCAVALGEPGPDGTRPLVWGVDAGKAAAAGGNFGVWIARNIGDPSAILGILGVGTTGGLGLVLTKLIRSWASAKADAASERAASAAHDDAWDEASGAKAAALARSSSVQPVIRTGLGGSLAGQPETQA